MRYKKTQRRDLTDEEKEQVVLLTEQGASACYIGEKLGFDTHRISQERSRLGVRGYYINAQHSEASQYASRIRPKHVKSAPGSRAWCEECDAAFSRVMTQYLTEYWQEKAEQGG